MTLLKKLNRKTAPPSGPDCIRISDGKNLGQCTEWVGYRDQDGYGALRHGGKHYRTHRMMWLATFSDPMELHVLHHCDNPSCVKIDHLWLGTNGDNVKDKMSKDRGLAGERNPSAKLNSEDVRKIRFMSNSGMSRKDIAAEFGVSYCSIRDIISGRYWSNVT